jgi:hypothetical protein
MYISSYSKNKTDIEFILNVYQKNYKKHKNAQKNQKTKKNQKKYKKLEKHKKTSYIYFHIYIHV